VPYRDFVIEYPPGAIPVFVLPTIGQSDAASSDAYRHAFDALMAAFGIGCLLAMTFVLSADGAGTTRTASALGLAAVAPLLLGSVILSRFDLWPALFATAAVGALISGRDGLGAAAIGLGFAVKIWPGLLAPLGFAWVWRRHGRRAALRWAAIGLAAAAAVVIPFAVVGAGGLRHSFGGQLGRPLQIESLGSAVLMAAHHLGGLGLTTETSHGSQNLAGEAARWIGGFSTALQVCTIAAIWAAFAHGPATRGRLLAAVAAVTATFIAFGKVFSPQFLIWLIPLVPLVRGRRGLVASALLAAALVLTQTWFPHHYWPLAEEYAQPESWLLLARDLAVAALALVLLDGLRSADQDVL
jgi:hypothetical protein